MKSDRYKQSTVIHSHQKQSSSSIPPIIKHVQNNQKYHRSNTTSQSIPTIIHTTIRSSTNNIGSLQKKPLHLKDNPHSFSTILAARCQQNETNKTFVSVNGIQKSNKIRCLSSVTSIDSYESLFIPQSSENSAKNLTQTNGQMTNDCNNIKKKDGWPDWTSFENEHHQNRNKKKKCTRRWIIISILFTILLAVIIAIILTILLIKQNSATTTASLNTNVMLRWNTTGITVAGITGHIGNASNLLQVPFGITLDFSGALYIADWSNHRVQKYSKGSSSGQTVAGQAMGSYNSTSNSLYYPGDVAVDSNGNVYVADTFNNRIQLWNSGSTSGTTVAGTGSSGSLLNELSRPHGLMRDENSKTLYISDSFNARVMRYQSGSLTGTVVAGGNGAGPNTTQISSPMGLYFDSLSNSILIANAGDNNIVRWTIGASSWALVAGNMNSTSGNTSTELNLPMDVTLDPMGNVYVADRGNHRIQLYMNGQSNGRTIAGITGSNGASSDKLDTPFSVALDNQLNLYVADTINQRVQKFLRY